ncbi:DEAD/DEAH box helicase [Prevotella sp. DNF00663]|uniref:DEAD/DEAH box helicase n=1 Tax=Prevotella sp. DNF00663 TaxID=1384078 RepID=UPI000783D6A6|nr:DEAD/DEAH box helicase [Prevotella sp. DNF00663]KXB85624.1 DEAD/DEAH box helicase [Prevotella sp. DNF00663]
MKGLDNIQQKLGIKLNGMQEAAMNAILHTNKDILVLSPTGSGKTLAYLLPLTQLLNPDNPQIQAVVIVPGRELALQSSEVLNNMGSGLKAIACYGGRTAMEEHRHTKQVCPHIIFATPGRLNDHLDKNNFNIDNIKFIIIDEFDKCLEMGFQNEMSRIFEKLSHVERHILLSATNAKSIPQFVQMGRTEKVDYLSTEQVPDRVTIYKVKSPVKDKLETLRQLLCDIGNQSSIVFLNYRDSVERTASYLEQNRFTVSAFHGGLEQKQREDALYKFTNKSANILISTDLASRGLDIPDIANIIHYHLPENEDGYIHRVGRTARWDKMGKTFFILGPDEALPDYIDGNMVDYQISEELPEPPKPQMATLYIGKGKKDKLSKGDIVGFLCKKGGLQITEIGRIDVKDRYTYVAVSHPRLQHVLQLVQGEKIKGVRTVIEEVK